MCSRQPSSCILGGRPFADHCSKKLDSALLLAALPCAVTSCPIPVVDYGCAKDPESWQPHSESTGAATKDTFLTEAGKEQALALRNCLTLGCRCHKPTDFQWWGAVFGIAASNYCRGRYMKYSYIIMYLK